MTMSAGPLDPALCRLPSRSGLARARAQADSGMFHDNCGETKGEVEISSAFLKFLFASSLLSKLGGEVQI